MPQSEIEERIREMVALVDEDEEPFDLRAEMLRLRTAHELLEKGHNIEAAAVLYGLQGRVARWALEGGYNDLGDSTPEKDFLHVGQVGRAAGRGRRRRP